MTCRRVSGRNVRILRGQSRADRSRAITRSYEPHPSRSDTRARLIDYRRPARRGRRGRGRGRDEGRRGEAGARRGRGGGAALIVSTRALIISHSIPRASINFFDGFFALSFNPLDLLSSRHRMEFLKRTIIFSSQYAKRYINSF